MLLDGDARTCSRSPTTLRVHFGILRPFIEHWAATRGHLREITPGDVDTVLERLREQCSWTAPVTGLAGAGLVLKVGFRFPGGKGGTRQPGCGYGTGTGPSGCMPPTRASRRMRC